MNAIKDELTSTGEIDRQFESEIAWAAATIGVLVPRDPGLAQWEHERIIITRALYRDMLHDNLKEFADMMALYLFYYEAGRRQQTNQPWAVDRFAMNGLHWGKNRFYLINKLLLEQCYIESIRRRRPEKW